MKGIQIGKGKSNFTICRWHNICSYLIKFIFNINISISGISIYICIYTLYIHTFIHLKQIKHIDLLKYVFIVKTSKNPFFYSHLTVSPQNFLLLYLVHFDQPFPISLSPLLFSALPTLNFLEMNFLMTAHEWDHMILVYYASLTHLFYLTLISIAIHEVINNSVSFSFYGWIVSIVYIYHIFIRHSHI
jgi:hypothetical protein